MCLQIDYLFTCGHRNFAKFDKCADFGLTCYGAGGNHEDKPVQDVCRDCKIRTYDPNPDGRSNDPYREKRSTPAGK
ncbi:hypothetical protein B0T24DRAFT_540060 [Lasiosphaeria ovina]|uniref:Uncharacterized protein n=1 Tax=Lasiosphaeria ovina TaxID=92902 RepID=A0AAE0JSX7_9PEZI|nr:hypothetical protein B0T24DRAFT_540060 [Lasiosphaeria ovina]